MGIYIVLFIILQKQVCFAGFFILVIAYFFWEIYNRELIENVLF
jgi:hypothetical protein